MGYWGKSVWAYFSVPSEGLRQEHQRFVPGQMGLSLYGPECHFAFFHSIKFKCALRQSVDLWPRAAFAQLESLTDLFRFFHICVSVVVLFQILKGDFGAVISIILTFHV